MGRFFESLLRTVPPTTNSDDSDSETGESASPAVSEAAKRFRCSKPVELKSVTDDLFDMDDDGEADEDEQTDERHDVKPVVPDGKKRVHIPADICDDPELKKLMSKSVLQPGFDTKPVESVLLKSKRRTKLDRKKLRAEDKGDAWFNMKAPEMTDEHRMDLELLRMRNSLDVKTPYRKNDLKVLPKFFQVGRIVENKADFYSGRLTKKERKRTMVDEIMQDYEALDKHKRRYDKIRAEKAKIRRGDSAFRPGRISKKAFRAKKRSKN
uniref:Fcf2 domain-containing protein n=1 Tax=Panagrellus redivivus TaxID=6233 RepID=A0A7E4W897_PANRE